MGGNKIGEAIVAGTLVPDASITALPRTTGQLVPADNGYPVKLQINKGLPTQPPICSTWGLRA